MKNFRKFRKNVKAISPVLSVLMMIAVAVAASLVTYAWVMGYLNFTTSKVGKSIQIQSIGIEGGKLIVYVQNIGDSAVTLNAKQCVYVNGILDTNLPSGNIDLLKGETSGITTGTDAVSGDTFVIRVVSSDGTFTEATKTFS
jgi:flagellin-like protein